ncbi:hypothetical protein [Intestinibacillus sp. Marseille-P6563]|uniref:hypothetical protein n=1 Tax=Intestinibacillus sp. Marseille-P6563 TaxID=2364792 RepID=UPI000F067DFC|nr:hypothetical protein [Intestinibacillus sp. Marseille-P6563]
MKILLKICEFVVTIVNVIAAILTIVLAVTQNSLSSWLAASIFVLIGSSILLYLCWVREHSRLRALRILAHRGRVNTINYMVYLDFLTHKFNNDYDNEPKTSSLIITRSNFTFHFFNGCADNKVIDVDYRHTFHLIKHGKKFDALILHAIGSLVRIPEKNDSRENPSTFIKYQDKYYSIIPEPCTGDMRNQRNQVLDRVQCSIPAMKAREETLEFHYRINGEFDVDDDDIFVIYPRNYGKKFNKEATFQLLFDDLYFADIQLLTLRYDYVIGGAIQYVAQFESDDGKTYTCTVKSLKERNIYMISIRHKAFLG